MKRVCILIFCILFTYCEKTEQHQSPKSCFNYNSANSEIMAGDTVRFTNCSSNSINYLWDFGDNCFSSDSKPLHIYTSAGIYKIILRVSDHETSDTISRIIKIDARPVLAGVTNNLMAYHKIEPEYYLNYKFDKCGYGDVADSICLFSDKNLDIFLKARFLDFDAFIKCCPPLADCSPSELTYNISSLKGLEFASYSELYISFVFPFADAFDQNYRIDTLTNWKTKTDLWNNNIPSPHQGRWYSIKEDKFLAIRKKSANTCKYGWIRIGIKSDHNLVFKEYALEK